MLVQRAVTEADTEPFPPTVLLLLCVLDLTRTEPITERLAYYFPFLLSRSRASGISFAGVTNESEEDVRYFAETYQRPLRSVTLLADEQGVLTDGYQVGARLLCRCGEFLVAQRANVCRYADVVVNVFTCKYGPGKSA